jgi:preprotein translocase subunit SecA
MENGQAREAAEHLHQVLKHCRTAPPSRQPELLHDLVRDTLERLFDLHTQSKGAIEFLPPFERPEGSETRPKDLRLIDLDMGSEETWETLTAMFLTGKVPDARARGRPLPLPQRPVLAPPSSRRIGRNDPCPCGSGRKFKHCCGKKR